MASAKYSLRIKYSLNEKSENQNSHSSITKSIYDIGTVSKNWTWWFCEISVYNAGNSWGSTVNDQALIWTLHASNIWTHPLFEKSWKVHLAWKSQKTHLNKGTEVSFCPIKASKCLSPNLVPFSLLQILLKMLFSFLLVRITFLPWHIIVHMLKLFSVNGYHLIYLIENIW